MLFICCLKIITDQLILALLDFGVIMLDLIEKYEVMLVLYSPTLLFCFLLNISYLIFSTFFGGVFWEGNVQTCEKVERKGNKFFWTRHSPSSTNIFASCASSNFPHPLNTTLHPCQNASFVFQIILMKIPNYLLHLLGTITFDSLNTGASVNLCGFSVYNSQRKSVQLGVGELAFFQSFCIFEFFFFPKRHFHYYELIASKHLL